MARVGFVGLGLIGTPMCMNLVKAGHQVTVWNRTPARMKPLTGRRRVSGLLAQRGGPRQRDRHHLRIRLPGRGARHRRPPAA